MSKTTDQLIRIVNAASASSQKPRIIIVNVNSKTVDQLVRIANAGPGLVNFDFI